MAGPAAAGVTSSNERSRTNTFAVNGATLGMGLEHALRKYPTAQIAPEPANCYNHGQAIRVPELTRRVLRKFDDEGELTLNFDPPYTGGWLNRILYDRPVDPATFDIDKLIDRLTAQYGAYDRILYRRKMEPVGRIVGFAWRSADGATLKVELRNDYRSSGDSLRLSFLARSPSRKPRPKPRTLMYLCETTPLGTWIPDTLLQAFTLLNMHLTLNHQYWAEQELTSKTNVLNGSGGAEPV